MQGTTPDATEGRLMSTGQSVQVSVDPTKLLGVMAVIRAADRMASRIGYCDEALTDPTVVEAAEMYRAIRAEWRP